MERRMDADRRRMVEVESSAVERDALPGSSVNTRQRGKSAETVQLDSPAMESTAKILMNALLPNRVILLPFAKTFLPDTPVLIVLPVTRVPQCKELD